MVAAHGEIWWADLGEPTGSGPGRRRPVLVVSSDEFNTSRIRTVVVAAVTSNLRLGAAPGNLTLPAEMSGLPKVSVVNVSQIATLDKELLVERVGSLPDRVVSQVEAGLRLVLGLAP